MKKKAPKEKKKLEINGNFRLPGEIFISTKINKQKHGKKKIKHGKSIKKREREREKKKKVKCIQKRKKGGA